MENNKTEHPPLTWLQFSVGKRLCYSLVPLSLLWALVIWALK